MIDPDAAAQERGSPPPHHTHTKDGPADCRRCQLLRAHPAADFFAAELELARQEIATLREHIDTDHAALARVWALAGRLERLGFTAAARDLREAVTGEREA